MKIWNYDNVIYIVHPVQATAAEHASVVTECRRLLDVGLKTHPKLAVYHDVRNLKSADNGYLQLWAEIGKAYQERCVYVTVVSSAWIRTLVKTVVFLGRFDILVVKTPAEAAERLAPQGFRLRPETEPV
jgi:hypothetical protein